MKPRKTIEETIRTKLDFTFDPPLRDQLLARALHEQKQSQETEPAINRPAIRRMIMKRSITKIATAAAIVLAVMAGIYALTGSVDGTSITIAEVRNAMQEVNWMRMSNKSGPEVAWYSFASKIQATVDEEGKIIFFDFIAGKRLVWEPGSEVIYESPIDDDRQFAGGVSGPFQGVNMIFDSLEAEKGWKVTKELGTYEGRSVEVWAARQPESESGPTSVYMVYIDVESKLPVALADASQEADGNLRIKTEASLDYPDTGPTDIYDAGAPRTAQIVPAAEQ